MDNDHGYQLDRIAPHLGELASKALMFDQFYNPHPQTFYQIESPKNYAEFAHTISGLPFSSRIYLNSSFIESCYFFDL